MTDTITSGRPKRQIKRKRYEEVDDSEDDGFEDKRDAPPTNDDDSEEWADEGDDDDSWTKSKKARKTESGVAKRAKAATDATPDAEVIAAKIASIGEQLRDAVDATNHKFWTGHNRVSRSFTVAVDDCTNATFEAMFPPHVGETTTTPKKTTVVTQRSLNAAQFKQCLGDDLGMSVLVQDKGNWNIYKPTVPRGMDKAIVQHADVTYSTSTKRVTLKCDVINANTKFKQERRQRTRHVFRRRFQGWF